MNPIRESGATAPNADLRRLKPNPREGNRAWLQRCGLQEGIILLGGTSLLDFRLRVAQSQLRGDLTPSYWSLCGILTGLDGSFQTVPLQPDDVAQVPSTNGVRTLTLRDINDAARWPNIAVIRFAGNMSSVLEQADKIVKRRTIIDLPELLLVWLGYGWAAGNADNPLLRSKGVPSAAFVETAHSLAGIELTPGLSSASSCPEAIWQAAKWWREYYEGAVSVGRGTDAQPVVPEGVYGVRQPSAAVALPKEAIASLTTQTTTSAASWAGGQLRKRM